MKSPQFGSSCVGGKIVCVNKITCWLWNYDQVKSKFLPLFRISLEKSHLYVLTALSRVDNQ